MKNKNISVSRQAHLIALLIGTLALGGCATPLSPVGSKKVEESHQLLKNYEIGKRLTVSVGDPVVKFQDYWLQISEAPGATLTKTVNLKGGLIDITLIAGQKYPVRGMITFEGANYTVVATTDSSLGYHGVLVRADGTLLNRVVAAASDGTVIVVVYTLVISDPSTRFVRETIQSVTTTKGYENFELLYTGTNSNGLNLTYREFSPDGLARVAFYQNLIYEAGAKNISFKKYRIGIDSASSDSITFTVLSDGH